MTSFNILGDVWIVVFVGTFLFAGYPTMATSNNEGLFEEVEAKVELTKVEERKVVPEMAVKNVDPEEDVEDNVQIKVEVKQTEGEMVEPEVEVTKVEPEVVDDKEIVETKVKVEDKGNLEKGKVKQKVESVRRNILHVIVDDLRPQLGAYKEFFPTLQKMNMSTPNLDSLAQRSALFTKAYAQYSLCGPSRTSFLTGRRPETTKVMDMSYFRDKDGGNFTSMPEFFRHNGYYTVGMGKVFHPHQQEAKYSWDKYYESYGDTNPKKVWTSLDGLVIPVNTKQRAADMLPDDAVKEQAIEELGKIAKMFKEEGGKKNFYMAIGFFKPHIPWVFPEEFQDVYPELSVQLPENMYVPKDMPQVAWYDYHSMLAKDSIIKKRSLATTFNSSLPHDLTLAYRRAYYTCVTYVDHLIGEVIKALQENDLGSDTIMVVHGDHGYALGEHAEWAKQTQFELTTRVPLMIRVPGQTDRGMTVDELVELVDLFPTLVQLSNLTPSKVPRCLGYTTTSAKLCHEGSSLVPLLDKPQTPIKDAVFSVHYKHMPKIHSPVMGKTILNKNFRYTLWVKATKDLQPLWKEVVAEEMYDLVEDHDETHNVAHLVKYKDMKSDLKSQLVAGWRKAIRS